MNDAIAGTPIAGTFEIHSIGYPHIREKLPYNATDADIAAARERLYQRIEEEKTRAYKRDARLRDKHAAAVKTNLNGDPV